MAFLKNHFYRLLQPERPKGETAKAQAALSLAALLEMDKVDVPALLKQLHSSPEGLTESQARHRLKAHGPNLVVHEKPDPWYLQLFRNFRTPFTLLLGALSIISFFTGDIAGGTVIAAMAFI